VVVALVDSRKARVFEYRDGSVEETSDLRADTFLGDLSDVGVGKRSVSHTGVRGETSTDQAQRILEASSERLLKDLVGVLSAKAGGHGFLVIGGPPEMVRHASEALPRSLGARVLEQPSLHLDMRESEIRIAAEEAASELTKRQQGELLETVIDGAKSRGRACLGRDETERALREMRVDTLLLSRSFIQNDPDFADRCVGTAFAQDAHVEELGGDGAARLDAEGGGIGARLRFRIRPEGKDVGDRESAA
jgi:peptide subunit release factor 1 (eRF1)